MESRLNRSVMGNGRIPVPLRIFAGCRRFQQLNLQAVSAGSPVRIGCGGTGGPSITAMRDSPAGGDSIMAPAAVPEITGRMFLRCMIPNCFQPLRSLWGAFLFLFAFTGSAWAHPVPDLPVRSHFQKGGTAEIRVEVDPRCFEADPEKIDYFQRETIDSLSAGELQAMKGKADLFAAQRLRFFFDPVGEVKPSFVWEFQKLGDGGVPLKDGDQSILKGRETVLVGSWKSNLAESTTGYRIEALPITPEKMGAPLDVMFVNFIGGRQVERYAVLFPGETSFTLDLTEQGIFANPGVRTPGSVGVEAEAGDWFSLFVTEIKHGFTHVIPEGLDHILFVLGVFLMTRKWKPLVLQISSFTVAHTLTLWLAAAHIVRIPANIVEPLIAASIVTVAIENIFHKRYTHWRLLIVFAFGLVHGLGFAGAMSARLDSTPSLVVGLLGINVGVEMGQLAIISVALLATFWITDARGYRNCVVIPGSILIALAGIWWVIERTLL